MYNGETNFYKKFRRDMRKPCAKAHMFELTRFLLEEAGETFLGRGKYYLRIAG